MEKKITILEIYSETKSNFENKKFKCKINHIILDFFKIKYPDSNLNILKWYHHFLGKLDNNIFKTQPLPEKPLNILKHHWYQMFPELEQFSFSQLKDFIK